MAVTFGNLLLIFLIVFLTVLVLFIRGVALKWREHKLSSSRFPNRDSVRIIFEERWTSGCSRESLWTRLGGANKCLWIVVTDSELWVSPHWPFGFLGMPYDLEHRISKRAISKIERTKKSVIVEFVRANGHAASLELRLRNTERFVDALGVQ